MPRRSRIHLEGAPLHIMQRDHNREPCFFTENDCVNYLHWLGEALIEAQSALHVDALMINHGASVAIVPLRRSRAPADYQDKRRWHQPRRKAKRGEP
jgi:hypothetical protein